MKFCLGALCVGLCVLFGGGVALRATTGACALPSSCTAGMTAGAGQPRVSPDVRYLHDILAAAHGNSIAFSDAAPAVRSASPDLSFTPTYTIFMPLLMTGPGVPVAPTGLTVTVASTSSVGLSWKAAVDGGSPVISYTVNYTPGNVSVAAGASCPAGTCSATINALSNCVTYTFSVKASNAYGSSASSAPVSGTPVQAADPPAQPGLALPSGAGARVSVTWNAPNAHGCAIDLYEIQVYRNSSLVTSFQTSMVSAILGSLTTCNYPSDTCGAGYTFTVRAHNAGGWSGESPSNSAVPKVSYLADNLRGVWSNSYSSGACTSCHGSGQAPDLSGPNDYQHASAEGALMYACPVRASPCSPGIHAGINTFGVNSAEYRTVHQWVLDGNPQ